MSYRFDMNQEVGKYISQMPKQWIEFLNKLMDDTGEKIKLTSYKRTVEEQAFVMNHDYTAEGIGKLYHIRPIWKNMRQDSDKMLIDLLTRTSMPSDPTECFKLYQKNSDTKKIWQELLKKFGQQIKNNTGFEHVLGYALDIAPSSINNKHAFNIQLKKLIADTKGILTNKTILYPNHKENAYHLVFKIK